MPVDGNLLFEFLFFIYLLIQYNNTYKTVWWYPYNHLASCMSLNFDFTNYHLAAFITVMLARRLVWALISEASQAGTTSVIHCVALILAHLVLLTLCGWVLCLTLVNLFHSHSFLSLLFLSYPLQVCNDRDPFLVSCSASLLRRFGVYVPLCCFHQENRTQLFPPDCDYMVLVFYVIRREVFKYDKFTNNYDCANKVSFSDCVSHYSQR